MFSLRKPSPAQIEAFLAAQAAEPLSYPHVGASGGPAPPGYRGVDVRAVIGRGRERFEQACSDLRHWRQFELGWVEACPANTPLEVGRNVAVVAHSAGLWAMNACRIVEVWNESSWPQPGEQARYLFGFAYGTLRHAGRGEERFLVEWNPSDDQVTYAIRSFSRPGYWMSWLGYPLFLSSQRRFVRESVAVMGRQAR